MNINDIDNMALIMPSQKNTKQVKSDSGGDKKSKKKARKKGKILPYLLSFAKISLVRMPTRRETREKWLIKRRSCEQKPLII